MSVVCGLHLVAHSGDSCCPRCLEDDRAALAKASPIDPPHYKSHPSGVECVTISEHFMGNVSKAIDYIWRHQHKGKPIEDLEKARWFIDREITRLKGAKP